MKIQTSRNEIFVCLTSERARERVARAVHVVGADPVDTSIGHLLAGTHPPLRRLVYDLHPWTPAAAATLMNIIETNTALHILLYVPVRADGLEMLPRFGGIDRVCSKVQNFSVATFGLLCGFIRFVNTGHVCPGYERVVTTAMPHLTQNLRSVLRVATARVTGAESRSAHKVLSLARDLHISSRTLTRRFMQGGLPPPKEFLDWMLLMHVAERAAREGRPAAGVARQLGYNTNAFYRIKKRRLGPAAGGNHLAVDLVRELFLKRCRSVGGRAPLEAAGPNQSVVGQRPISTDPLENVRQRVSQDRRVRIVANRIQHT
ncbi:MAG: AraC family transcriptional regulator [Gemmatimonadetes bacterium]|nr:AraC family transcriptional regulator [Gemmatimonadota bacterium]